MKTVEASPIAAPGLRSCRGAAKGVAQASLATGLWIRLGVLSTDTMEQALDRAGGKPGNKSAHAALAALEQVSLRAALG